MGKKKPLEPLIPLDELKSVVAGMFRVPKGKIGESDPKKPRRKGPKPEKGRKAN